MLISNKFHHCKAAGERETDRQTNRKQPSGEGEPMGVSGCKHTRRQAGVWDTDTHRVVVPPDIQQDPTAMLPGVGCVPSLQGLVPGNASRDVHKDCPRCLWGWQRDTYMLLFG